jgi:hypothetical protein
MVRPCTRSLSLIAKQALIALPMEKDQANCMLVAATNPTEAASKQAPLVTPQKGKKKQAAKSKEKIYFRVTLKDNPSQFIIGKTALERFKADYGTLVVKVYGYSSKKNFEEMRKKNAKETFNPKTNEKIAKRDDSNLARSIIDEMVDDSDRDAFRGLYHIKCDSSLCVVVIRLTGQKGDDHWCWKPDIMTKIISKIFRHSETHDEAIKSAFDNLAFAPSPNPDDFTRETQKVISYTPKNSSRTVSVYINVAYTFFTVPIDKLSSKEEEQAWITSKLTTFFNEMKSAMLSKTFKAVMDSMNQQYAEKIFDTARFGNNLPSFLNKARISLSAVTDITSLFTRQTTEHLMKMLFKHRLPSVKYLGDQSEEAVCQPENEQDEDEDVGSDGDSIS